MSTISIALITLGLTFTGSLFGRFLRYLLPDNHLNEHARDVVKLTLGLIATMAALMLGLLINSANNSMDTMSNELVEASTTIVELDQTLAAYGPETAELRQLLRKIVDAALEKIGPDDILKAGNTEKVDIAKALQTVQRKLRSLSPKDNAQAALQSQAFQEVKDLTHSRQLLLDYKKKQISSVLLYVVIFWLIFIFVGFGLLAPRNKTLIGVLFVCSLAVSAAIFIIMEMNNPYNGFISISAAPLRNAQEELSRQ
jgi:hypothetical protein